MINISQGGGDTPGLENLGIGWVHQGRTADGWHPDHHLTLWMPHISECTLTELGRTGAKGVWNAVPVQQLAHRVRAAAVLWGNNDNLAKVRGFAARPFLDELGDDTVEQLVRGYPRLEYVVANVAYGDAPQDLVCGLRMCPGAPRYEERAPRVGMQAPRGLEDLASSVLNASSGKSSPRTRKSDPNARCSSASILPSRRGSASTASSSGRSPQS